MLTPIFMKCDHPMMTPGSTETGCEINCFNITNLGS